VLIVGGNQSAAGYDIDNSLRFDQGSSDYLNRTPSTGNTKTWTWSGWVKRAKLASTDGIFGARTGGGLPEVYQFISSDVLQFYNYTGSFQFNFSTNRLFRDTSAWYHIVFAYDSTQATASNRFKLYVNGVQETSFSTATYPPLNYDSFMNSAVAHYIGAGSPADGSYFNGYLSEINFIDGQQLDPTSFGEFDSDSGVWKPKAYTGSYGTNGFFLEFQNSAALGTDSSSNGNNFTVNNLTSIDQTTDTPTNNFATGNPLVPTTLTYSNGNNTITHGADWKASPSTIAVTQGKWYAEMKLDSAGLGVTYGVEDMDLVYIWSAVLVGTSVNGRGYYSSDGTVYNNTAPSAFGATYTSGDTVGIALDMDNKFVYFHKNGTYQNGGVPTSGASGTGGLSLAGTTYAFAYASYTSTGSLNFGNPPYTISSGNSDGNGYGNFEYAVPSGYYALCTKNLAEYG